ncbi:MAG: hypothetical protein RL681_372 [Candidatus Parcubacteria bacterium]|jgi:hypothetical protein
MRIARTLLVLFVLLMVFISAPVGATTSQALPPGADDQLKLYPDLGRRLTVDDMAKFGLHPMRLEKPLAVFNLWRSLRKEGRMVYETLPIGALVLVTPEGRAVYKEDCGNPVVVPSVCPTCPEAKAIVDAAVPPPATPTFWDRFWNGLWETIKNFLRALATVALLALACAAIYFMFRGLTGMIRSFRRTPGPAPIPAPGPSPTPVTPVPPPPTPVVPPSPPVAPALPSGIVVGPGTLYPPPGSHVEIDYATGTIRIFMRGTLVRFVALPPRPPRKRPVKP